MTALGVLTLLHTAISLISVVLGALAISGLFQHPRVQTWTGWFLIGAIATTASGFLFPFNGVTPAFATGILATLVFIALLLARYAFHETGHWREVYALGLLASLYLLVFVTIAQAFLKIPPLKALAPTGTEPPFIVAQLICLAVFAWIGFRLIRTLRLGARGPQA